MIKTDKEMADILAENERLNQEMHSLFTQIKESNDIFSKIKIIVFGLGPMNVSNGRIIDGIESLIKNNTDFYKEIAVSKSIVTAKDDEITRLTRLIRIVLKDKTLKNENKNFDYSD